ncbi:MAG: ATP-binding protein [Gemmatimonadota bacterium]|jgi:signal transduction histidine kinase/DNA-binding response OmpR family regulator|nr:ATP-binding protein [Gemmatimonadota bacterium]
MDPHVDTQDPTTAAILVVDDQDANVELLESILRDDGYLNVRSTTDSRRVIPLFQERAPDLILLDLHMPHLDGFAVMRQLAEHIPEESFLPIVVLTADSTPEAKRRALSGGAHDFLTKPLDQTEVSLRIRNLLRTRSLHLQQQTAREKAEAAERRAAFLAEASRVLATSFDYQTTIAKLARLAVPQLADICVVDVLEPDGRYLQLGVAAVDPAKEAVLRQAAPVDGSREHPLDAVFRRGEPLLLPEVSEEALEGILGGDRSRALMERLQPRSAMVVPLQAAERPVGWLTLVCSESGLGYGPEELALAEALAGRAALAVENARLFLQAQEATRVRDETLAVVAHDLRNPLSTITMGSSLLLEETVGDPGRAEQHQHLLIILRSAEWMNRMIEDLLDVTRMESGGFHLQRRAEAVPALLDEALAMLEPIAAAQGIHVEREIGDACPSIWVDGARFLQVVSNLVGNAIKFTPRDGWIRLGVRPQQGEVRFSVSDTGPGIPPEQLPHIFGRFWQAHRADRRGIGLGLGIAKGIVDAHGGRIWVESVFGEGSTFYFTVPPADATAELPV